MMIRQQGAATRSVCKYAHRTVPAVRAHRPARAVARVSAVHASSPATAGPTEKDRGFIAEMRKVAMKLHTKDQAPKEGGKEAAKTPMAAWQPSREGYLQFLAESKAVYDALEGIVSTNSTYAPFRNSGLERSAALAADIAWFKQTYGLVPGPVTADGPGMTYAKLLADLAVSDPPGFICHYYNFYFAHTAGGRMIGNKIAGMLLDGKDLQFYQYVGDVQVSLEGVRKKINNMAETWSAPQKEHCLQETEKSFKFSGGIMRCITGAAGH